MPVISDKQMAKFKALYKAHFGEDLSPQDVLDKAMIQSIFRYESHDSSTNIQKQPLNYTNGRQTN